MKLKTIKEIESLSANHANFYTTPENHDWHGRYSSYKNSYIKAQQDLLSQASEGFEEWIYQAPDKCDLREFEKSHHNFFVAQEAWQAAKLSSAREIEKLRGIIKNMKELPPTKELIRIQKENEELRDQLKWALSYLDMNLGDSDWKKAFRLMVIHEVRHRQVRWNHPELIEEAKKIKGEAK